eukprot:2148564-Rhodomonas_salina.1
MEEEEEEEEGLSKAVRGVWEDVCVGLVPVPGKSTCYLPMRMLCYARTGLATRAAVIAIQWRPRRISSRPGQQSAMRLRLARSQSPDMANAYLLASVVLTLGYGATRGAWEGAANANVAAGHAPSMHALLPFMQAVLLFTEACRHLWVQ